MSDERRKNVELFETVNEGMSLGVHPSIISFTKTFDVVFPLICCSSVVIFGKKITS